MSEAAGAKKAPEKKVAPKAEKKSAPAKKEVPKERSFVQQIHDRKNRAFDKKMTK